MSRKPMQRMARAVSGAAILAAFLLFGGADAVAEPLPVATDGKHTAIVTEPLRCWWRADKSSIRIGEEVTVTLTCRMAETGVQKTVLADSLLDPGALMLTPYRVKAGGRSKDLSRVIPGPEGPVTFRTVQYGYTVTLIGEGFFGRDVPIPPLEVRYRVDFAAESGSVTSGKDRSYLLPSLPMRIQSLVPDTASDIRDVGGVTVGDSGQLRNNAILAFIAAGVFLLLPSAFLVPAVVRTVRRRRSAAAGAILGRQELLRHLARALGRVGRQCRRTAWDDASVGTVLTALRVGIALAVGQRIAQASISAENRGVQGQLAFRTGFLYRRTILISAALTPEASAKALAGVNREGTVAARRMALLDGVQRAFAAVNGARYAPEGNPAERAVLDGALEHAQLLVGELRRDHFPFSGAMRAVADRCMSGRRRWKRS